MHPRYRLPLGRLLPLACDVLAGRQRSFHRDALALVSEIAPPLQVYGQEHVPSAGPCLITLNHYSRPGFRAWWLGLAISAVVPAEVHWIMTAGWTFPGRPGRRVLQAASQWVFKRAAAVYGFSAMPPMPPAPSESTARALAVRRVLAYARSSRQPLIATAPEGRDFPGGILGRPPAGVGRFLLQLNHLGLRLVPAGAFEQDGTFCLRFGAAYTLEVLPDLSRAEQDRQASYCIMQRIACQLPPALRGEWAGESCLKEPL